MKDVNASPVNVASADETPDGAALVNVGPVNVGPVNAASGASSAAVPSAVTAVPFAGKRVPRLGMGTMALAIEGRPDWNTAIGTIHAALDAGVRYLDTAWSYYLPSAPGTDGTGVATDFGYGELLVRDALASWDGPRDEVLVATKTGYRRTIDVTPDGPRTPNEPEEETGSPDVPGVHITHIGESAEHSEFPAPAGTSAPVPNASGEPPAQSRQRLQAAGSRYGWMADSRPETMIRDAKESARRLGVDALDLLYSHGPDPSVPYEETVGALKTLLDEGVIRYAGVSRVSNEQIDVSRAILGKGLIAVQNQFSPSHPDPEHTMAHCAELGLDFVCWSPLGGFLDPVDARAYEPFKRVAAARGCSYQRVVLAWELTRYNRLFTIPSARNPHEIRDSFSATGMRLDADELALLDTAVLGR